MVRRLGERAGSLLERADLVGWLMKDSNRDRGHIRNIMISKSCCISQYKSMMTYPVHGLLFYEAGAQFWAPATRKA